MVRKVRLHFAKGLDIEFCDRDRAIKQVYQLAEKGTLYPVVVYGPEGCGKSAWLLQSVEMLKDEGYSVVYFNPVMRLFEVEVGIESFKQKALEVVKQAVSEHEIARLVWLAIDFAVEVLKQKRERLAIVIDDVFQYTTPREAALLVKGLLNVIEYPPESYESVVAIAATSEGLSRYEIGKHRWGDLVPMWNMAKRGFEELYEKISKPKPGFDEVWMFTGGNPGTLRSLYQFNWNTDIFVKKFIDVKGLVGDFIDRWIKWLELLIDDIDILAKADFPKELREELIAKNLVIYPVTSRDLELWIDEPPPEKDPELGIGRYAAWQTPLYREAVKKALLKEHP